MSETQQLVALDDLAVNTLWTTDHKGIINFATVHDEMASYVFVRSQGKFYNPLNGSWLTVSAFDIEFCGAVEKGDGKPSVFAKSKLGVRSVEDTAYNPREPAGSIFAQNGALYVNSMLPNQVPETDEDWILSDAWLTCHEHLINLLGDDHIHILNWMAWNVQKTGQKILWAPIIVGTQGDGKTTLMKILAAAIGVKNVKFVSPETLDSSFNGYAEGAAAVALEEIRVVGKNRHPIMEKLKPLITNEIVEVHEKFRAGRQILNCTNYIAFTNHSDALVIDAHDRRWGVFRTQFKDRDELNSKLTPEYWKKLHSAIENNHSVIRGWLMDMSVEDFDPTVAPPLTDAKLKMIQSSRSGAATEIEQVLGTCDGVSNSAVLTICLKEAMHDHGFRIPSGRGLGKAMEDLGFSPFDRPVRFGDRKPSRGFYRPASFAGETPDLARFKEALIVNEYVDETEIDKDNPF